MQLSVRPSLPALLLLGLSVAALSCGDSTGPNGEKLVNVNDNSFNPATLTIAAGQTVLWQWKGSNPHNVTWDTQSGAGNSATQTTGTYSRTFNDAGTYDYHCTVHAGMQGNVVVQ